jgi:hypothetical protein
MCCSVPPENHVVAICAQEKNTKEIMETHYPYNTTGTSGNVLVTSGSTTWTDGYFVAAADDKKANIEKFIFSVESENRLKMILEKVKAKKLSVDEAIAILKGDNSIEIG